MIFIIIIGIIIYYVLSNAWDIIERGIEEEWQ